MSEDRGRKVGARPLLQSVLCRAPSVLRLANATRPGGFPFGRRASPFLSFRALEKRFRGGAGRLRSRRTHGPRHLAAPRQPGGEPGWVEVGRTASPPFPRRP